MTHRQMVQSLSAQEYNEWVGLYLLEAKERSEAEKKSRQQSGGRGRKRPRRRR